MDKYILDGPVCEIKELDTNRAAARAFTSWPLGIAAPSSLVLSLVKPLSRDTDGKHKELDGSDPWRPCRKYCKRSSGRSSFCVKLFSQI